MRGILVHSLICSVATKATKWGWGVELGFGLEARGLESE